MSDFFAGRREFVQEVLARFPAGKERSAVLPLLHEVQRVERKVSGGRIAEIADLTGMTSTEVYGVMSFYPHFTEQEVGETHILLCQTLTCSLLGADRLADRLVQGLGIAPGETSADGKVSLAKAECLGACYGGPVLQVWRTGPDSPHGEREAVYLERVTARVCDRLIAALKAGRDWEAELADHVSKPGRSPGEPLPFDDGELVGEGR
jgi:NADH-quinone oxidoreductase subunit E